ncbi:MAG: hypothetical protein GKR91_10230 [Pseudomonadales bacterium]|nr:hypothetical protein [Pseudomonadales bacterium]
MKTALLWFQRLFLFGSITFLLSVLYLNREDITEVFSQAAIAGILLASGLWILTVLIAPSIAFIILRDRNNEIRLTTLLSIYISRIPAKYLPGGVWQTFARAYDMNSLGISRTDIGLVVFYENFWTVYLASVISTLGIYVLNSNPMYSSLALALFIGSLIVIPIAFVLRKQAFVIGKLSYVKLTAICLLFWIFAALAFFSYLNSLGVIPVSYDPLLLMIHYQFSYVVGFVAIFAPQGVGVFEAVMVELSQFDLPAIQAMVLIAGFRVVVLVSDFIVWFAFILLGRSRSTSSD